MYSLPGRYDNTHDYYDDQRLRHLVFLDGLLVDSFTESVTGSAYACLALEADAARREAAPPQPPPEPEHERVLAWLDAVAGGRRALLDLDVEPLRDDGPDIPADHPTYDAAADLLERVAGDVFGDGEVWPAARHVLDRVWVEDPDLLTGRRTVPQVAGGVLWVVGRANGLFGPAPATRQKDVQRALWLSQSLSTPGRAVEQCLRRLDVERCVRPWGLPALEPVGDVRVLTSATRRDLAAWRDRALDAQRRHALDEEAKVLPPRVES